MDVKVEDLGNCKRKMVIEIPAEKVAEELDKRTTELRSSAELKGFRKGHIPEKLFEKRFGKNLREAVRNDLTAEAFQEALTEHSLEPLGEPQFPGMEEMELVSEASFKFEVELVVKPQVKVDDYIGVKVQAEEIQLADDEIEGMIGQMRRERAELVVVEDRKSEDKDMLLIDVDLSAEGQTLHSSKNSYVGAGSKGIFGIEIDGLSEKLTGLKSGDSVELEFELPKTSALDYGEEMAGKTAKCSLKVNEIKTLKEPEATDEWAKEIGFESMEDLREKAKKEITVAKERARDRYVEKKILDGLHEANDFEVPADLMDERAHELTEYRRYQLMRSGVEKEKIDADLDSYKELSRTEIERNFRDSLVLQKIAELENIFVTEDEVTQAIVQIALSKGQSPDALQEEMESRGMVSQLRGDLLETRVKEFLREKAEVELLPPGSLSQEDEKTDEKQEVSETEETDKSEEEQAEEKSE